jgi:hypothetical protein
MWRALVAALLFFAFIPGVVVTLPSKSAKKTTVYIVHALLFAVVLQLIMTSFYFESFGNHGAAGCPAGYVESMKHGKEECVLAAGTRQNPPGLSKEKK